MASAAEPLRLGEQAEHQVGGEDLGVAGLVRRVVRRHHRVLGPEREAGEALLGRRGSFGQEALARRLLGHAHRPPDVGPRRPGATGLVDEVPDEVVGEVAEVIGRDHRAGQLFELVVVDRADRVDQVVETDGGRQGRGHDDNLRLSPAT